MLGRSRKLTLATLWNEERSDDCVLLGSTAVYRRLMDPSSDCCGPAASDFVCDGYYNQRDSQFQNIRGRFEKSESEDSGIELPPISPFGSESSYNPEEPESLESSVPEEPETLKHFTPYDLKDSASVETDILDVSDSESPRTLTCKDSARLETSSTEDLERDMTGVPFKLEQAVLRSRRQRGSRESHHNWAGRSGRHYQGSLKDQRRLKQHSLRTRSPPRPHQEEEVKDLLPLPGDGLQYLENLCLMLEHIAELQQKNLRLQQEKRKVEEKMYNTVPFIDTCVCGSNRPHRVSNLEDPDGALPETRTWKAQHYRKRSCSHTGVLQFTSQPQDNNLIGAAKLEPHFVSVPNLKDEDRSSMDQNCKTPQSEFSQWDKIKYLISKLSRKAAGNAEAPGVLRAEMQSNCRSQTLLESSSNPQRRLFLPALVIRPRTRQRQQFR
ncbi:uncharacterized protein C8orf58 homolog [Discoglossus pictus]